MIQFELKDLPPDIRKQAEAKLENEKSKFSSVKTTVDGHVFDSKKEASYYAELKLREQFGEIRDLKLQPRYVLQEGFYYNKIHFRKIEYVADFKCFDVQKNQRVVADVKGYKTDVYKLKKKLFLKKYGQKVLFLEV